MTLQGFYVGNDMSRLAATNAWLGTSAQIVGAQTGRASWSDWIGSINWMIGNMKAVPATLRWSIPMFANSGTLKDAAAGTYNSYYVQAAKALVAAYGTTNPIIIRTGEEFNASWMPWAAASDPASFVKAYQNFVTAFRSVSSNFKFEWNVNVDGGMNPALAYPGDSYVDYIGMDFYWDSTKSWSIQDPVKAFNYFKNSTYGLQWLENFAAAHGKQTAYSEWGVNSTNASAYLALVKQWFDSHNVAYELYWNSNAVFSGQLDTGQYGEASVEFQKLFGNSNTVIKSSSTGDAAFYYDASGHLTGIDGFSTVGALVYSNRYDAATGALLRQKGYDGSGNLITDIIHNGDGSTALTLYDSTGKITEQDSFDANGKILTAYQIFADGSTQATSFNAGTPTLQTGKDAQGNKSYVNLFSTAGVLIEQDGFATDGRQTIAIIHAADGSQTIRLFGATEALAREIDYSATGTVTSTRNVDADGSSTFAIYTSGVLTSLSGYDSAGHATFTNRFDGTGVLVEQIGYDSAGNETTQILHRADGTSALTLWDAMGRIYEQDVFDASGKIIAAQQNFADGTSQSTSFSAGVPVSQTGYDAQGQKAYLNSFDASGFLMTQTGFDAAGQQVQVIAHAANASFTVSNLLVGGGYDISGHGDGAMLIGSQYGDRFTGGGNSQTFAFSGIIGADSIGNFHTGTQTGHDLLQIDHTLFADYASLMASTHDVSGGTLIRIDGNNSVLLQNVSSAQLVAADVLFK